MSPAEIDIELMKMVEAGDLRIVGKTPEGNNLYETTEQGRLKYGTKR